MSPLTALMKDQVSTITKMGLSAAVISDRESMSSTVKNRIKNGEFQIVFISPESPFMSKEWKNTLSSKVYRDNLAGFIVDEAHCIKKW